MSRRVLLYMPAQLRQSAAIMHAVLAYARNAGWQLRLGDPDGQDEAERARAWGADGVIAYNWNQERVRVFRGQVRALVVLAARDPGEEDATVFPDFRGHGHIAADFFLERGFHRFACLGARTGGCLMDERRDGFIQRLHQAGRSCHYHEQEHGSQSLWRDPDPSVVDWVAGLPERCALFATGVRIGCDVLDACLHAGIAVPEHLAVIAANNDTVLCDTAEPPLAAVPMPWRRVAFEAARLLDQRLQGRPPRKRLLRIASGPVILRRSAEASAIADPELCAAMQLIEADACAPLDVATLCRRLGIGRRSLERRFRRQLDRTPKQEIDRVRLCRAERLLLESDEQITRIAHLTGFDPSVFSRVFAAHHGCSAREWRERERGPNEIIDG